MILVKYINGLVIQNIIIRNLKQDSILFGCLVDHTDISTLTVVLLQERKCDLIYNSYYEL